MALKELTSALRGRVDGRPHPRGEVEAYLEGGDVEVLPEGEAQNVEVLAAVAERAGQSDEDYEEDRGRGGTGGGERGQGRGVNA